MMKGVSKMIGKDLETWSHSVINYGNSFNNNYHFFLVTNQTLPTASLKKEKKDFVTAVVRLMVLR